MVRFFIKFNPSAREIIKGCRGEWSWLECAKEVLFMEWSTWSAKGGKRDNVDALSYTLVSGKGSSYARQSFHCFKGVRKELKRKSNVVNRWWHMRCPMSGWWTEVQRSSMQYGRSRRL